MLPFKRKAPNGSTHISGSSVPAFSRGHSKVNDNVSPVLIGTKMVEWVINMRKLAPPSTMTDNLLMVTTLGSHLHSQTVQALVDHSQRNPLIWLYVTCVRSGSARSRTVSVSDSRLATSSNASSEV